MFSKKYVFETRSTRRIRVFRNAVLFFLAGVVSLSLAGLYIPIYAKKQNELTAQTLYPGAPDVIAVFTGDAGRIDHAFKMTQKFPSAKLFISGVHVKNSVRTLLYNQGKGISVEEFLEQESHHIDLDYLARNTVENGIATINYLREHENFKKVLIISSDYHILRIALIMDTLADNSEELTFHYESLEMDYSSWKNFKKLAKEVYKLLKTTTFLMFWDRN